MASGYASTASTPKYNAKVNQAWPNITSPRLETRPPPDRRAAPRQWSRSVHTPRSFFALQRRAPGNQCEREQQEHADQHEKQDIHRYSKDRTQPGLNLS